MHSQVDIGWIAGIIDGEGSITFSRHGKWRRPALSVSSTDVEIIQRLKELLGGGYWKAKVERKNRPKYKPQWVWKLNGSKQVLKVLELIEPVLRCPKKKSRAKFLLENYAKNTPRNGYYTEEMIERKKLMEINFFEQ